MYLHFTSFSIDITRNVNNQRRELQRNDSQFFVFRLLSWRPDIESSGMLTIDEASVNEFFSLAKADWFDSRCSIVRKVRSTIQQWNLLQVNIIVWCVLVVLLVVVVAHRINQMVCPVLGLAPLIEQVCSHKTNQIFLHSFFRTTFGLRSLSNRFD